MKEWISWLSPPVSGLTEAIHQTLAQDQLTDDDGSKSGGRGIGLVDDSNDYHTGGESSKNWLGSKAVSVDEILVAPGSSADGCHVLIGSDGDIEATAIGAAH